MVIKTAHDMSEEFIKRNISDLRNASMTTLYNNREMLIDFYEGRQDKEEYLEGYGFKDVNLPLQILNIFKKVIHKISLIYKDAPDRSLGENKEGDAYNEFIGDNPSFNISLLEAERWKNVLDICLYTYLYTDRGWRPYIYTDFVPHFLDDDPLYPVAYSIALPQDISETGVQFIPENQWYWYVSDTEWFLHNASGEKRFDEAYKDGKHNLGRMPIVELRSGIPVNEYWSDGRLDLMKSNQLINVNLNNLNAAIQLQAFDKVIFEGVGADEVNSLAWNPTKAIGVKDSEANIHTLGFNPKIDQIIGAIKFQIEAISRNYNINVDWSMSGDASSGFALLVKNIDLLEARQDDVKMAKMQERSIYEIIQAQDQAYKLGLKLPELKGDNKLVVDFQEVNFPVNYAEEQERWSWEFEHSISTPLDYIQSKNPDMSEEEALEKYDKNKTLNEKLTKGQQAFRDVLQEIEEQEDGATDDQTF